MKKNLSNYEQTNRRICRLNIFTFAFMALLYVASCCGPCSEQNKNQKASIVTNHTIERLPTENYLSYIETYVIDGYKFYVFCCNNNIVVIPESVCKGESKDDSYNSWLYN